MVETLVLMLWAFGDLPAAMGWQGEVVFGPQAFFILPLGPVELLLGTPREFALRVRLNPGPFFLWADIPPPRLVLGRAAGPFLLGFSRDPSGFTLCWDLPLFRWLSLQGALGSVSFMGFRFRSGPGWLGGLIEGGRLWLWAGSYF
ncbi:MAG TPA: hypothetical protein ENF77_02715 [Candidatus Acetothermia bacterium]|nr:hypothetical protein [Candidatus Acetothermia bacterium]